MITLFAGMFSSKNSLDHEQVLFSILVNAVMNMVVTLNGRHLVKPIGRMTGVRKPATIMAMAINQTQTKSIPNSNTNSNCGLKNGTHCSPLKPYL